MTFTQQVGWSPPIETPYPDEAERIREASQEILRRGNGDAQVFVKTPNDPHQVIPIPLSAFRFLQHILTQLAEGQGVTLIPMHAELNTDEAAQVLKVSRRFLLGLLESGEIASRVTEAGPWILYKDLIAYKQKTAENRAKALAELSALDQELGLE